MSERLVRFNEVGLVVTPPPLDCLGPEECPRYESNGSCFVDEHHLYFPRTKFDHHRDELVREFATHSFNRIMMARCQHDRIHDIHDSALIPPHDTMKHFLHEADILKQFGVVVNALEEIERAFAATNPRKRPRNPVKYLDWYSQFSEKKDELAVHVDQFEVIPKRLVLAGIGRFKGAAQLAY